jgi:DTW domain-containing protein YfiP
MSRRNNAASRCTRCRMHSSLCVCPLIPRLDTRTRLVLVIHRAEDRKPTNTGRLAVEAMPNSEVIVRGRAEEPADAIAWNESTRPLFLFPHEDAVPLESIATIAGDDRPVTLIVPDGNWRQASKVRNRVPGMRDVPCVSLPIGAPSIYRLRSEAHPFGLATVEAIGRCLRVLEGDAGPEVERALLHVFRAMVERTLWSRGDFETHAVTGGIPDGALRHDPRSGAHSGPRSGAGSGVE